MNEQIHIYFESPEQIRAVLKGDKETVVKMVITSMEASDELAALIITAAMSYFKRRSIVIVHPFDY